MNFQVEAYKKRLGELLETIEKCEKILSDEKEVKKVIKKELRSIKKEFGKERKTELSKKGKSLIMKRYL